MKKYFCSFLFVFVLLMICPDVLGQNKTSSFDYPFKPGSETWNQYSSTLERVYALQIPDNVIVNLSTDTLLDICLDYPFLIELCLDDNYQKNFDLISSQFNGLSELLNRSDLFEALLNKNSILMNRASEMKAC